MSREKQIGAINVNNLTDARYFAAHMVDWLAFRFDPKTADGISQDQIVEIMDWLDGLDYFLDIGMNTLEQVKPELLERCKGIKLDAFAKVDTIRKTYNGLIMQELPIDLYRANGDQPTTADFYILTQTEEQDVDLILELCLHKNMIIPGNLQASILQTSTTFEQAKGFYLKGSHEERPGYKSFDELDALFEGWEE